MPTGEHSRRRTTQRLLLLAAATGAGAVAGLAFSSAAHADDHREPALTDTAIAVGDGVRGTVQKAVAPKPRAQDPTTLARDLAERTTRRVDRAARRTPHGVKKITAIVDQAAAPRSVLGGAVDTTTDLTDRIVDTAPAVLAPPALPGLTAPAVGVTIPPAGTMAAHAAPQTAPEPASEQPPLVTAGSGAPMLLHPCMGAGLAELTGWAAAELDVVASADPSGSPRGGQLGGGSRDRATVASTVDNHHATPGDRWTQPLRWQEATISYIADRDGRTHPPSPPSG